MAQLNENIKKIASIETGSGTAIEAGLKMIGEKISIADAENCKIMLLTDGENNKKIDSCLENKT